MTQFRRTNPNTFANNPLDRAAHRRGDPQWLEAALHAPDSAVIIINQQRQILVSDEAAGGPEGFGVKWLRGNVRMLCGAEAPLLFLGVIGETPYFAIGAPASFDLQQIPLAAQFADLRGAAMRLSADDAAIAGLGAWLLDWHARHGFCAACGAHTQMMEAGWKRVCGACKTEHFPRVDPVAIMLATRGDRCLLGRQKMFPPGMYSALAGFVEPGETVEEACVRELFEEAGVKARAGAVDYLFAQPWPFPSSLMFGLLVEADTDDIRIDEMELETARWFTRDEVRAMRDGGLTTPEGALFVPPAFAVARRIIDVWLDG